VELQAVSGSFYFFPHFVCNNLLFYHSWRVVHGLWTKKELIVMPIKRFQKSAIRDQLKKLQSVFDKLSKNAPPSPRQAIYRDEARTFVQSFGSDANADHADEMLSLDPFGAEAFLLVANDFLERALDGTEVAVDIEETQENTDFGILFQFVLERLLDLASKDRRLYKQPLD
jgi:hypothetical protein